MSKELVIIPVYNEAPSLQRVLDTVHRVFSGEVLVINDGSTDGSRELLQRYTEGKTKVLDHAVNQGYGASLMDGFRYAKTQGYDSIVTMDCDEQHEPGLIPTLFRRVQEADIVSGSRYLNEIRKEGTVPEDRRRINATITAALNRITGYEITDAFCGFKAYRVAPLARLHLDESGYAFPLQVWIQAARQNLSVVEVAVPLIYKDNFERRFGGVLDDPERRLKHYYDVIEKEVAKCSTC